MLLLASICLMLEVIMKPATNALELVKLCCSNVALQLTCQDDGIDLDPMRITMSMIFPLPCR